MGLFRRRASRFVDPRPAIREFWAWWSDHRNDVVAAFDEDRLDDLLNMLQPVVSAIDDRLTWQTTSSQTKRFGLVVSSGGVPEVRATAERWLLTAPDDPDVEFFSTRKRDPAFFESASVKVDDFDFPMNELVANARVDSATGKVNVVVHHPLFTLIDDDHRLHVAFMGLDAALGEEAVQRWLGSIEVSVDSPVDAIPVASLSEVVDQLSARGGGGGEWAAMEGVGPRGPVFAIIRRAAGPDTHPLADTHVAVVLGYDAAENGMPTDPSISTEIEEFEADVVQAFGGDGPHVVHIGHITGAGQVVAHFYVDGLEIDPGVAKPVLDKWSRGKATMATSRDPGWEHVAPFMG
jgi:hypothetical protein